MLQGSKVWEHIKHLHGSDSFFARVHHASFDSLGVGKTRFYELNGLVFLVSLVSRTEHPRVDLLLVALVQLEGIRYLTSEPLDLIECNELL